MVLARGNHGRFKFRSANPWVGVGIENRGRHVPLSRFGSGAALPSRGALVSHEGFEEALKSGALVFHCNTCETDWPPSH